MTRGAWLALCREQGGAAGLAPGHRGQLYKSPGWAATDFGSRCRAAAGKAGRAGRTGRLRPGLATVGALRGLQVAAGRAGARSRLGGAAGASRTSRARAAGAAGAGRRRERSGEGAWRAVTGDWLSGPALAEVARGACRAASVGAGAAGGRQRVGEVTRGTRTLFWLRRAPGAESAGGTGLARPAAVLCGADSGAAGVGAGRTAAVHRLRIAARAIAAWWTAEAGPSGRRWFDARLVRDPYHLSVKKAARTTRETDFCGSTEPQSRVLSLAVRLGRGIAQRGTARARTGGAVKAAARHRRQGAGVPVDGACQSTTDV